MTIFRRFGGDPDRRKSHAALVREIKTHRALNRDYERRIGVSHYEKQMRAYIKGIARLRRLVARLKREQQRERDNYDQALDFLEAIVEVADQNSGFGFSCGQLARFHLGLANDPEWVAERFIRNLRRLAGQ